MHPSWMHEGWLCTTRQGDIMGDGHLQPQKSGLPPWPSAQCAAVPLPVCHVPSQPPPRPAGTDCLIHPGKPSGHCQDLSTPEPPEAATNTLGMAKAQSGAGKRWM